MTVRKNTQRKAQENTYEEPELNKLHKIVVYQLVCTYSMKAFCYTCRLSREDSTS